nr:MAG TPA: hypothetical protein [Caudoviricetes sp.]
MYYFHNKRVFQYIYFCVLLHIELSSIIVYIYINK